MYEQPATTGYVHVGSSGSRTAGYQVGFPVTKFDVLVLTISYIDDRHTPSQHRQAQPQGQIYTDVSSLGVSKHSRGLMPAGRICGTSMAFLFPRDGVQPRGCPSQKTSPIILQLVQHSRAQSVMSRLLQGKGKREMYLEGG